MLEKMGEFFNSRLDGYEEHQLTTIDSAQEFYPFTAACLPQKDGSRILDLGCGTGLELGYYFEKVPSARVTGIDLAEGMLDKLKSKFQDKALELIHGSYFDVPFEEGAYDAVVSVESLHHFRAIIFLRITSLHRKRRKCFTAGDCWKLRRQRI